MKKRVWFNLETGVFSNSWKREFMLDKEESYIGGIDSDSKWKLIEYECLTDSNFEFCNLMQVVTNRKGVN